MFDEFWEAYPKKVGKQPAHKKWKQKHLDAKAEMIIADVIWRKGRSQQWNKGFVPNPATYLHQERWDDERDDIQAGKAKDGKDSIDAVKARNEYTRVLQESQRRGFFTAMRHLRDLYARARAGDKTEGVRKFMSESKKWPQKVRDKYAPFIRGDTDDLVALVEKPEDE